MKFRKSIPSVKKVLSVLSDVLCVAFLLGIAVVLLVGMTGIVDDCTAECDSTAWCVMTMRLQAAKQLVK